MSPKSLESTWVIREALHNCIAHQDYGLHGRIVVVEFPDRVLLTNVGVFLPGDVETVIRQDAPQAIYRNPFLADAMVELNMIDTQGGGIKRMFETQRRRSFPLPDYDLTNPGQVVVGISGRILDERYTRLLMEQTDLSLGQVMLLDRVQKRQCIEHDDHRRLKAAGLIEGRYPSLMVAGAIAKVTGEKASWFLPFNQGWSDGAGNPPNLNGLKTDYLWKRILTRDGLTDILENYAQVVETRDEKTGRKKAMQIWPRFHQLDVVRRLLVDVGRHGAGCRYLIQHSAGSGKSNSIAWLAHQLIGQGRAVSPRPPQDGRHGEASPPIFDSIIVVTDRRILDQQIRNTIKQFAQVGATVGAVKEGDGSKTKQLSEYLDQGKKIIIVTVQTFPAALDKIGSEHRGKNFAILIDEAHSSQGGRTSAAVSMALGTAGAEEDQETTEDKINRLMEAKKLLPNASYFAFTATPYSRPGLCL